MIGAITLCWAEIVKEIWLFQLIKRCLYQWTVIFSVIFLLSFVNNV